jgi:hypothetical protein
MRPLLIFLLLAPNAFALDLSLHYEAGVYPDNNEIVVGDKIGRYKLSVEPKIETTYLTYTQTFDLYGVNTWQPADLDLATDWSAEEWRGTSTSRISVGPGPKFRVFSEYFTPLGDWSPKGATNLSSYWWLVGVEGDFE